MHTRRNRLRWRAFDYTAAAAYFVTLCVHNRRCLFGRVIDGRMQLNAAGRMVEDLWRRMGERFPFVRLYEFVVMPNHLHGIVLVTGQRPESRAALGDVIGWFKSQTTLAYGDGVRRHGWPRFDRRLWQRSYHDRVLRDEDEWCHAAGYVWRNPHQWREDPMHPRAEPGTVFDVPWEG